jgi:large subunit ribosomal protein L17
MLANMATSLITYKRINTTTAKAKALRKYIEPLLTKAKDDSVHSRRTVFSFLQDKKAVTELFQEISQKIADRPGGYTRIIKTGYRLGDNAQMCFIELVDYNANMLKNASGKKTPKTRRSRRKVAVTQNLETKEPAKEIIEDQKAVIENLATDEAEPEKD